MRASRLRADFRLRDGRTALGDVCCTAPLKLAKPFPVEGHPGGVLAIVMDVSPGLMDGDRYELAWDIGPGSSLAVTTQSYAKVHPCPEGGAEQETRIFVGEGASLVYAPQPAMLYADASFRTRTRVELAPDASLLLLDTLCAGRVHYGAGEAFRYRLYESEVVITRRGRVAAASRMRLAPGEQELGLPGVFESDTHVGKLYGLGPFAAGPLAETLLAEADRAERGARVRCGVSPLAEGGVAAVVLGASAWEVHGTLLRLGRAFAAFARETLPAACPPPAWPADW